MPATNFKGATRSLSRLLSSSFDQVHSMDTTNEATSLHIMLDAFQKQVSELFNDLATSDFELLSIQWLHKLLDVFICCHHEFKAIICSDKDALNKSPMDRYVSEFFERSVKALDVCNAIRDGIEQIRQWQKQLEIVLCALDNQRSMGEGQIRRARKAMIELVIVMLDEKESSASLTHRNWSFGRSNTHKEKRSLSHFRSLSWSVSRSWSAAKQLQAIGNNISAPKPYEVMATNGLVGAVFTMNYVLLFTMWALVAAIPCQDRGLQTHFSAPRQYGWAFPINSLHEKILEESKKKDRRSACGLLREIHEVEKCVRRVNESLDSVQFPLTDEKERDVRQRVKDLGIVYDSIKEGLDPLERQVREVFHRIVRSRTDGFVSVYHS
ncbi:hypothetical protein LIER_32488 [Lithospermum erythrorhizon]|uniref:Uncharacterized protein n=1 Tax=Lithospermum erythrorhizon TaxID=34254 RepID=A0AAV3RWG6_LITER